MSIHAEDVESATPEAAQSNGLSVSQRLALEKLMLVTQMEGQWNEILLPSLREELKERSSPEVLDQFLARHLRFEQMKPRIMEEYAAVMTPDEINAFAAFIESPKVAPVMERLRLALRDTRDPKAMKKIMDERSEEELMAFDHFFQSAVWKSMRTKISGFPERLRNLVSGIVYAHIDELSE